MPFEESTVVPTFCKRTIMTRQIQFRKYQQPLKAHLYISLSCCNPCRVDLPITMPLFLVTKSQRLAPPDKLRPEGVPTFFTGFFTFSINPLSQFSGFLAQEYYLHAGVQVWRGGGLMTMIRTHGQAEFQPAP